METAAMMTETEQYLEKIKAIAESAVTDATSRSAPPSRKSSLTATNTTTTAGLFADTESQSFMSSNQGSEKSTRSSRDTLEQQDSASGNRDTREQQDSTRSNTREQKDSTSAPSSSAEMSDTKLSRFYHAMGSSESSAAERREQEERARREAEERARRQSSEK
jgi:hypothetical protein